jgi:probable F420-dependent oxidoreductase
MRSEYEEAGIPFDPASVRIERLGEAVRIIKSLLAGQPASLDGCYYRVREHRGYPPPTQQPRPPILIGGNGPKLLSLAAREADIVGFTGLGFQKGGSQVDVSGFKADSVDERVQWVRSEAGARFAELELNTLVQLVTVTDDRQQAAADLSARWPAITAEDVLETPYALVGTVDQMVEALQARRRRWGFSYVVTHEPYLDALAPVVARLAGT